jgi:N-dimethylarginine dimethylaminohydrolase
MQKFVETAFTFDKRRNCVVPFQQTAHMSPGTLDERLSDFRIYRNAPDNLTYARALRSIERPLAIPYADVSRQKTAEQPVPVVMCRPSGYRTLRYDLGNPRHLDVCIANQSNALRWELIKSTLEQIGAKVIVADSARLNTEATPECVSPQSDLSTLEVFARDTGFIYRGEYFAPSRQMHEAIYRASTTERATQLFAKMGYKDLATSAKQQAHIDFQERSITNLIDAFRKADVTIRPRRIDAVFDGGNVAPIPKKGLIFVGKDRLELPTEQQRLASQRIQLWHQLIGDATGARVIPIDCGERQNMDTANRFHVDMMMAELPGEELLLDRRNTSQRSYDRLKKIFEEIVFVDADNPQYVHDDVEERLITNCPANLVPIGRTLFMQSASDKLRTSLTRRDYRVVSAKDLGVHPSMLAINAGSIHCLTLT